MFDAIAEKLQRRSVALLLTLDNRLDRILIWWLVLAGLAAAVRIGAASQVIVISPNSAFASYLLLVVAPFASTLLALRWFRDGHLQPQPTIRLAVAGSWRALERSEAERHPLYGTSGIMVSLLVGMMLNVPVRAAEYLTSIPPMPTVAPHWLAVLHFLMTLDLVLFSSLYMIAFVAALRRVPLFPRLLLAIWLGDLAMQLITAQMVASTDVPAGVASALHAVLDGNVKKVLISMGLWLPYLLLSGRVNVTYRRRIPA